MAESSEASFPVAVLAGLVTVPLREENVEPERKVKAHSLACRELNHLSLQAARRYLICFGWSLQ